MSSESASKNRAKEGIAICLKDMGDGNSRLMIDDIVADDPEAQSPVWRHKVFYTTNTYPNDALDNMELTDDELCQIGVAVVVRLLAINDRVSEDNIRILCNTLRFEFRSFELIHHVP